MLLVLLLSIEYLLRKFLRKTILKILILLQRARLFLFQMQNRRIFFQVFYGLLTAGELPAVMDGEEIPLIMNIKNSIKEWI